MFFLHGYFSNFLEVREMSLFRVLSGVIFPLNWEDETPSAASNIPCLETQDSPEEK